jgi:hypothetical protein
MLIEALQYLIMNLGMSPGFQHQDFKHMTVPNEMRVDYIRVYQREGVSEGSTCNPSKYPTANYIAKCVSVSFLSSHPLACMHGC